MKYIIVENGTVRQLQVTNVSAADEGLYSCTVQNKQSVAKLLVARMFHIHLFLVLCIFVNVCNSVRYNSGEFLSMLSLQLAIT